MKKLICLFMALLCLTGCKEKRVFIDDLNVVPNDMMSYETMSEPSSHFLEITMEESLRFFEEGGSGILMISRSTCPHCLNAVPVMAEIAEKYDLTIYYVDCGKDFDAEHLNQLEQYTKDVLGKRGLMVPIVFSIINGKAVDQHIGTIAEEDGLLSDEQKEQVISIYEDLLKDWIN
ncbi:MAG: conjugal transfer protein TraF [Erysipelotrichaceae bacterium]|nr:conjugal transfer protein TraF [Erysipelotrichaceae bacterium]